MQIRDDGLERTFTTTTCPATERIRSGLYTSLTTDEQRLNIDNRACAHPRPTRTVVAHSPDSFAMQISKHGGERPSPLNLPITRPISNTIPNLHVHIGPHAFTLSTCAEHRQATRNSLCRWSCWHCLRQSSRASQTPGKKANPAHCAREHEDPVNCDEDCWTDSVQQNAPSSMGVPNVAFEQRLKTLHSLCFTAFSGKHMARAYL